MAEGSILAPAFLMGPGRMAKAMIDHGKMHHCRNIIIHDITGDAENAECPTRCRVRGRPAK